MISDNVKRVREKIAEAAMASGRNPDEITLVAASKTRNSGEIREAILAGVDACGENRVQELTEKYSEDAYAGTQLHFIGRLQNNKVRKVVGTAALIQSADMSNIDDISKQAAKLGIIQDVLLQINIGNEAQKGGVAPESAGDFFSYAAEYARNVRIVGIMSIPPLHVENMPNYEHYEQMLKIYVDKLDFMLHNSSKPVLSMGMSGDFEIAVRLGSNMVRVGTAIFGERNYH